MKDWLESLGLGVYAVASIASGYDDPRMIRRMEKTEVEQWVVDAGMNNGSKAKLLAEWRAAKEWRGDEDRMSTQSRPMIQSDHTALSPAKYFDKLIGTGDEKAQNCNPNNMVHGRVHSGNNSTASGTTNTDHDGNDYESVASMGESKTTEEQVVLTKELNMMLMQALIVHNAKYNANETVVLTVAEGQIRFQCGVCGLTEAKLPQGKHQFKNFLLGHCLRGSIHRTNYKGKHGSMYEHGDPVKMDENDGAEDWDTNWLRTEEHMQCRSCQQKVMIKTTARGERDKRWRANCMMHTKVCKGMLGSKKNSGVYNDKVGKSDMLTKPSLYDQMKRPRTEGTPYALQTKAAKLVCWPDVSGASDSRLLIKSSALNTTHNPLEFTSTAGELPLRVQSSTLVEHETTPSEQSEAGSNAQE